MANQGIFFLKYRRVLCYAFPVRPHTKHICKQVLLEALQPSAATGSPCHMGTGAVHLGTA